MPWEGYTVAITPGRGGGSSTWRRKRSTSAVTARCPASRKPEGTRIRIFPHFQSPYEVDIWKAGGGHGGSIRSGREQRRVNQRSERARQYCAGGSAWWGMVDLTGIAGNRSMEWGRPARSTSWCTGWSCPTIRPCPTRPSRSIRCRLNTRRPRGGRSEDGSSVAHAFRPRISWIDTEIGAVRRLESVKSVQSVANSAYA